MRHPQANFSDVPDLPKVALKLLTDKFTLSSSKVVTQQSSTDGETTKLLVRLQDGLEVEAVIMTYDTTGTTLKQALDQDLTVVDRITPVSRSYTS